MMSRTFAAALCFALASCASLPIGQPAAPSAPRIPATPLELGDWRRASAETALSQFERIVAGRYAAGLALAAVTADLQLYEFTCAAPRAAAARGDPPARTCRKTVSLNGCTHTWQAHLFDANGDGALARTRALYDRRCGGDGLLGGPD